MNSQLSIASSWQQKAISFLFFTLGIAAISMPALAATTAVRSYTPSQYAPGQPVLITVVVTPDASVLSYALRENAPPFWTVSTTYPGASAFQSSTTVGGTLIYPGFVKFPVYFDNTARTFTYIAIPPANATGAQTLSGLISTDGTSVAVTGPTSITRDVTAPTATLTAPVAGANVRGTISVAGTATDNIAVSSVQFRMDGTNIGPRLTAAPFAFSWNTVGINGSHTITMVAWDAANNVMTSAGATINLDNTAPTVQVTAPGSGAGIKGTVTVAGTATDNISVSSVQFRLDGADIAGGRLTVAPYTFSWNTAFVPAGQHNLTIVAWDALNNVATSANVTITVDNTAPVASIFSPAIGSFVRGSITIAGTAGDTVLLSSAQLRLDGVDMTGGRFTAMPVALTWNTTVVGDGAHTITLVAWDGLNNTVTSTPINVTVDNTAPTISITAPTGGANLMGSVTVSASAADTIGIASVQFYVDGNIIPTGRFTTAPFSFSWNSASVSNGTHVLTANAWDGARNVTTSLGVTVTANNVPMHPADGILGTNPDFQIGQDEVTKYGNCWRSAPAVPTGCPAGANVDYATKAAAIYITNDLGSYHFDPTPGLQPPAYWVAD